MQNTNRRSFLHSGVLALGGTFLTGASSPLLAATAGPAPALTPTDREVIGFFRKFGARVILQGGCVAAKIGGNHAATHLVVQVSNLKGMIEMMGDGSLEALGECHANGNTLAFERDGTEFTVENLVPELFADRIRNLQLSTTGDLGSPHEALQFDTASGVLADPFDTLKEPAVVLASNERFGQLLRKLRKLKKRQRKTQRKNGAKQIRRLKKEADRIANSPTPVAGGGRAELRLFPSATNQSPVDAFRTLTRALIDKIRFGLAPNASFEGLKAQILNSETRLDPRDSRAICRVFTRAVSSLSEDRKTVKDLLDSPLLNRCLAETFGIDGAEIVSNFNRLRSSSDASYTDGAIWLALLLFDEIERGRSFPWIDQEDSFQLSKAKADLSQASLAFLN